MAEDYPVNVVFQSMDRISQPVQRINNRIERLTGPVRRFNNRMRALGRNSGLQQITAAAGRVRGALGRVSAAAGRVATRLGIIGGLGAAAVARVVSNVADMGDEFAKSARSMGISVDFLQEYQFAAERLGVTKKTLNTSLVAFSKRLGEMKNGYGRLRTLLKETNPELQAQLETAGSTEQAFQLLMDAMSKMEDPSRRSALAAAAFSRQGVRLTNIAQAGGEEVARLRERARELGLVMDSNATGSAEKYQDALTNMKAALTGASVVISTELMPVFTDLMAKFTNWLVENKAAVQGWAESFAAGLPGHLRAIRDAAVSLFEAMAPVVERVAALLDTFGEGYAVLAAIGVILAGPLLGAVALLGVKFAALATALATTPLGWFLAGVAAIAAGIYGLQKAMAWLEQRFPAAFQVAQDAFGVFVDALLSPIDLISGRFDAFMEKIERIGTTIGRYVPDWFSGAGSEGSGPELKITTNRARGAAPAAPSGASEAIAAGVVSQAHRMTINRRKRKVALHFNNLPEGSRVRHESDADDDTVDLSFGRGRGS